MKNKLITLLVLVSLCVWAGDRSPAPTNGTGKSKFTMRRTDRPVYAKLTFVPGYAGCSFYYPAATGNAIEVTFREAGKGEFKPVLTPSYNRREKLWRGSIVNLKENTAYEVQISVDGNVVETGKFITKGALPKIAKTIVLNEKNFKGHLQITAQGKPNGWIRYTCAPGFVLTNDHKQPVINLKKAKYVILDKIVINGGGHKAVTVNYCSNIRITECDISGWGVLDAKPEFEKLGGKPGYINANGKLCSTNYSAGIELNYGDNILIERCYIHDPAGHANSWRYSHPSGPCAIFAVCPTSTTIRYNDLVANDLGRWNDAVEGLYNFNEDGGFNRDAEIYGNFMIFCQDDNIELDGGQQNVRCFGNRFEASYCGVSIQGCMSGPCYVFNNMFISTGDQFGNNGQNIKTSTKCSGLDAIAYVLNNSFTGGGTGFSMSALLKAVVMNNAFDASFVHDEDGKMKKMKSVSDYNVMPKAKKVVPGKNGKLAAPGYLNSANGVLEPAENSPLVGKGAVIANFTPEKDVNIGAFQKGTILPLRPMPVKTSVNRMTFDVKNGAAPAQQFKVTVCGKNYKSAFKVVQSKTCNWFEVTPASGVFESGKEIEFTVKVKPEYMNEQHLYRGAFMLRQDNGLSRPVSVYATTEFSQKARLHKEGDFAIYVNSEDYIEGSGKVDVINDPQADGGKALRMYQSKDGKPFVYEINVPKAGTYHLMLRCRSGHRPRVRIAIDDAKLTDAALSIMSYWSWSTIRNDQKVKVSNPWSCKVGSYDLSAGKHTIKLLPLGFKDVDLIALTDNPLAYEPR